MLVSAVLTFRGRTAGLMLYLGVFAGTLLWALWETGLQFWPLVPRLVAPVFLAGVALLLLPAASRASLPARAARDLAAPGCWRSSPPSLC
ncbi:hypothetical protein LCM28_07010 [Salipiger pacificus]|nr:hypothetical protein [Alloyangia pacifica]